MTVTKVVRYRTRDASAAAENARLIEDVFAELAVKAPAGLKYSALRLEDGLSFVHVAEFSGDDNPLSDCAAFAEFQSGIVLLKARSPPMPLGWAASAPDHPVQWMHRGGQIATGQDQGAVAQIA